MWSFVTAAQSHWHTSHHGPHREPAPELPDCLSSLCSGRCGSACPALAPHGGAAAQIRSTPKCPAHSGANKTSSKMFVGGRRGTEEAAQESCLEGLHTPRCWEPCQDQDGRGGCQGQEPVWTARGRQLDGAVTHYRMARSQLAGLPLAGGECTAPACGPGRGLSPLLSLPSSNEPLLVPSSAPQLLMVCKNPGPVPRESRHSPCPK